MKEKYEIKTVDASNVDEAGFFCYMSKRKEAGYKQKRDWLEARFAEGMKLKVIHEIQLFDEKLIFKIDACWVDGIGDD